MTKSLSTLLEDAVSQFTQKNETSKQLHEDAAQTLPGGNTRTVLHTSPFPLYMKSGNGHQVQSEDGKTYTDLTGEFTAALYGHSNPDILAAVNSVIQTVGLNLGGTTAQENLFAKEICRRFSLERVRFANSGTEANLHALAAARAFTGKRKVVAFGGGYHGGVLMFGTNGQPAPNTVDRDDWIVASYNDLDSARDAIRQEGVAAVILEAMQGSAGCIRGSTEFLQGVQEAASEAGVIFILDEVMTSRTSAHGLAEVLQLKPDLKTFGKYLGGGMAFGAFGGRADIMATFDPRLGGSLHHSGTFNNNTLVTHTGYAGLTNVYTAEAAEQFTQMGDRLREKLNEATKRTKVHFTGVGSIMAVHITKHGGRGMVRAGQVEEIHELKELFWFEMLQEGFWVARRGFIALILGTPEEELDRFVEAVKRFINKYRQFVAILT